MENAPREFDKKHIRISLEKENEFISDMLISLDVPDSVQDECMELYLTKNKNEAISLEKHHAKPGKNQDEVKERKEIIMNKMRSKKPKISNKGIKKRNLKNMKAHKELASAIRSVQSINKNEVKEEKGQIGQIIKRLDPVFNEGGKIVFSKFDFASHPGGKNKKTKKDKVMKNPVDLLKTIKEQRKTISHLVEQGEQGKALAIKKQLAWKKAFDKTEGKKVKDDPSLLLKAVKKKKDLKKSSKKKWIERTQKVEQSIAKNQQKRQENLNKRSKDKKVKLLKGLSKRGRVIPGF